MLSAHLAPLLSHRRVLWVDDDPRHNVAETRLLRTLGVDIENALTTVEAVDRLHRDPARFDLVISDWTRGDARRDRRSSSGFVPTALTYRSSFTRATRGRSAAPGPLSLVP